MSANIKLLTALQRALEYIADNEPLLVSPQGDDTHEEDAIRAQGELDAVYHGGVNAISDAFGVPAARALAMGPQELGFLDSHKSPARGFAV